MKKKWKKMSLLKKVVIIYAVVVIFPVFMLVSYLSLSQYDRLYTETISSKQLALEQLTQSIQNSLSTVEALSQNLAYRSPIAALISRKHLENLPTWTKRSSEEIIEALSFTLKYQNRGVEDIAIYSDRSELCDQEKFFNISTLYEFDFYDDFRFTQKESDFYFLNKETAEKYYKNKNGEVHTDEILIFVRNIRNEEEENYSGMLVFEIDPDKFLLSFQREGRNREEYSIYFTNTQELWGAPVEDCLISKIQSSASANTVNFSEVSSGYLYSYLEDYNLVVIDRSRIEKNSYIFLAVRFFLLFSILIVVQALSLRIMIRYTMNKVDKNINEMDHIIANGFEGQITVDECDEFRSITMRYNVLLKKIQALICDMIKKEGDKKEAQIKALQYQMNPHFIYNTLSIFASDAEENGNYRLSEAIAYFGHLLRYNIKNTGMFATVGEEINNAYSLIKVYSIRFGENLSLELDVPQELYPAEIIKYLLQPILENSIIHGGTREKGIRIRIKVRQSGNVLMVVIEDNGKGVEKEYLKKIRENIMEGRQLENNSSSGSSFIGLRNIYKRLRLIYGEESELLIDSQADEGTAVTIKIPVKDFEERKER